MMRAAFVMVQGRLRIVVEPDTSHEAMLLQQFIRYDANAIRVAAVDRSEYVGPECLDAPIRSLTLEAETE